MTLQMSILFVALLSLSSALVCPDGGMCEDRNTCCRNAAGGYGCCPLPHAECCSDHLHCCYEGTACDLVHATCVNKTVSLPWMSRLPARQVLPLAQRPQAVVCPDQQSECPDDTTCCQLLDGSWGCCPLPKAVCCEDKLHCCPEGTQCDVPHSRCVSASSLQSFPMLQKIPATRREARPAVRSVTCPGGKSSCPDSFTCCLLPSGDYGCCPYPEATCCSDHLHCCPTNTVCDLAHGICRSTETQQVLVLEKVSAASTVVECPDKESFCPDQTTCCQMANGSYGCCPMPDAVCCSDHIHCCPEGTQCDLVHSACVTSQGQTSMAVKVRSPGTELVPAESKVAVVACNSSVVCPDGSTCCKTAEGQWACCPLPKAVCCDDHLHCCPHGTICNLAASTCDDPAGGGAVTPWLDKEPAFPLLSDNSKCDKSTSCPGKATCCRTASGGWACCPLPQAVCCDDHVHCCPHGTVCDLESESCDDPSSVLPSRRWVQKVPALSGENVENVQDENVENVQDEKCDKQTMCPGGTTCCKKESGMWACCPLPQAVCCNDHEHCCPKGYRCNVAAQTCDKPDAVSLPWLGKIPPLHAADPALLAPAPPRPDGNMCDSRTSCPDDATCCFIQRSQEWGCCPLPKAVCCSDGDHCCPSGHTCEPRRSSCSRGLHVVPWVAKVSARTEPSAAAVGDVKCDDKSSCASGTTCCRLPSGAWGCCPLVKAVCCEDHEHCCPQGYICNMETSTCEKKTLPPLRSVVVRPELSDHGEEKDVPCDGAGEFRCPERDTCCRVSAEEWACCPSPKAVCCSDFKHCCPAGFTCDLESGGCSFSWDALFQDRRRDVLRRRL